MKIILSVLFLGLNLIASSQQVTDIDGNVYNTINVGPQVWMAENLKVTHYQNGDSIPYIVNDSVWGHIEKGACCDMFNSPDTSEIYGKYYNFFAVNDSRNVCPTGWHVPTNLEFVTLSKHLGGDSIFNGSYYTDENVGGKLKETGFSHWKSPNEGAKDSVGFKALPGGYRNPDGTFHQLHYGCYIWSSDQYFGLELAYQSYWYMTYDHAYIQQEFIAEIKNTGSSIRCIMDERPNAISTAGKTNNVIVYPNPVKGLLNINITNEKIENIQIYDCSGRILLNSDMYLKPINVSEFNMGYYVVQIKTDKNVYIEKVMFE